MSCASSASPRAAGGEAAAALCASAGLLLLQRGEAAFVPSWAPCCGCASALAPAVLRVLSKPAGRDLEPQGAQLRSVAQLCRGKGLEQALLVGAQGLACGRRVLAPTSPRQLHF